MKRWRPDGDDPLTVIAFVFGFIILGTLAAAIFFAMKGEWILAGTFLFGFLMLVEPWKFWRDE